jgi:hypothetical protein
MTISLACLQSFAERAPYLQTLGYFLHDFNGIIRKKELNRLVKVSNDHKKAGIMRHCSSLKEIESLSKVTERMDILTSVFVLITKLHGRKYGI